MTQPPGFGPPPPGGPPPGHYYGPPPAYPPPGYRLVPPPPTSPGGMPLADFGTRLAAYIIDAVLVSIMFAVVAIPAFFLFFTRTLPSDEELARSQDPGLIFSSFLVPLLLFELGLFVLILIAYYFYAVEYMHRSGQTLGKKIMKIRVVPLDPTRTLTRGMAAKRYLVEFVAGSLVPFFSYLDGLWQLWDKPFLQTLHDKAAQTVVVKVSP